MNIIETIRGLRADASEYVQAAQRRAFGRCEFCGKRLAGQKWRVIGGYEWNGWLHSEGGLWHLACFDEHPVLGRQSNIRAIGGRR
jgi:hypothetical protein